MGILYVLALAVGTTASSYQYFGIKDGRPHWYNDVNHNDVLAVTADNNEDMLKRIESILGDKFNREAFDVIMLGAHVMERSEAFSLLRLRDNRRPRNIGDNQIKVVVDFWNTLRPQTFADAVNTQTTIPPVSTANSFMSNFIDLGMMGDDIYESDEDRPDFTFDTRQELIIVDFHSSQGIIEEYISKHFGDYVRYTLLTDGADIADAIGTADLYIAANTMQFDGRFVEPEGIAGHRYWNQSDCEWADPTVCDELKTNIRMAQEAAAATGLETCQA